MTYAQFQAIATLLRLREHPSKRAAEMVLIHGNRHCDAAKAMGITPSAVSNCLRRIRAGMELARVAAGCNEG